MPRNAILYLLCIAHCQTLQPAEAFQDYLKPRNYSRPQDVLGFWKGANLQGLTTSYRRWASWDLRAFGIHLKGDRLAYLHNILALPPEEPGA